MIIAGNIDCEFCGREQAEERYGIHVCGPCEVVLHKFAQSCPVCGEGWIDTCGVCGEQPNAPRLSRKFEDENA